jgi:hypothetical protein
LLPDAIRALGDDQLQVEVLNKIGDSVELRVRIDFAKRAVNAGLRILPHVWLHTRVPTCTKLPE